MSILSLKPWNTQHRLIRAIVKFYSANWIVSLISEGFFFPIYLSAFSFCVTFACFLRSESTFNGLWTLKFTSSSDGFYRVLLNSAELYHLWNRLIFEWVILLKQNFESGDGVTSIANLVPLSVKLLSRVQLFATLGTVAHQAPLSVGFSRQEYWSGLPFPSPWDLPNPGIKPGSPALQADCLSSEPPGNIIGLDYPLKSHRFNTFSSLWLTRTWISLILLSTREIFFFTAPIHSISRLLESYSL